MIGLEGFINVSPRLAVAEVLTSGFDALMVPLTGVYFPSGTASAPDDDPSINSIGGGRRLLKVSMSRTGLYCDASSEDCWGENESIGYRSDASIIGLPRAHGQIRAPRARQIRAGRRERAEKTRRFTVAAVERLESNLGHVPGQRFTCYRYIQHVAQAVRGMF